MKILNEKSVQLITDIENTLQAFINKTATFTDGQFNTVPYKNSWTPAQVARHVSISASGFCDLINGPVTDTHREPDEMAEHIKSTFLNFSVKMQSPDFVAPEDKHFDKVALLDTLTKTKAALTHALKTLDLNKTCTAFELPESGRLTRFEAAVFVLYHTQRHIHQLNKMSMYFADGVGIND